MTPASEPDTTGSRKSAAGEYEFQLRTLEGLQTAAAGRGRLYGIGKLAIAVLTLIAAGFLIHHLSGLLVLIAPIAGFLVLAVLHERTLEESRYRARAIRFYEDGLARLNDSWRGRGETGER